MPELVVVSGHPRTGSRTLGLARALGDAFATRRVGPDPVIVDVAELGPGLLTPGDAATRTALDTVQDATVLVVATPTYKGSYTGVLKALFDQLPANALAGTVAVPVVTAGIQPQADATEALLRRLLRELGADVADFGLTVIESELPDAAAIAARYAAAINL